MPTSLAPEIIAALVMLCGERFDRADEVQYHCTAGTAECQFSVKAREDFALECAMDTAKRWEEEHKDAD